MVRRVLGVAVASVLGGCLFTFDDDGDGPGGAGGPAVCFVGTSADADETDGTLDIGLALSEPSNQIVTVVIEAAGSAIAGEDYSSVSGLVIFPPGVTYQFRPLQIVPDDVPEPEEAVELTLVGATNARIGADSRYTFTIRENLLPRITFASAMSYAGEYETDLAAFIQVLPASPIPITVDIVRGGTAGTADSTLASRTVTIPAGVTAYQVPLELIDDTLDEDNETLEVTLSNPVNAILGEIATYTHNIGENDPRVAASFQMADQTLTEGDSGMQVVTIDVVLDMPSGRMLDISFEADLGTTAAAGVDYMLLTPSPLVFAPGVTSQTISIGIIGDALQDGTERVRLHVLHSSGTHNTTWPDYHTITIDNDECLGPAAFAVCPDTAPTTALTLSGSDFTSGGDPCAPDQPPGWLEAGHPDACVVVARDITIESFRAMGPRPLVLVALDTITVNGLLDVSTHMDSYPAGAGANPSSCLPFGAAAGAQAGGAGGSFITAGAEGGAHGAPSGPGGVPSAEVPPPNILRGGCAGQTVEHASGGAGGGAVYLVAGSSITLSSGAAVNASGGSGRGGWLSHGGGGGGSGGMIVLWAPSITATGARVLANGAGGGEGSYNTADGVDGSNPLASSPLSPAPGGSGTSGGDGGAGAVQVIAATAGASANNNAGGGGGGGGLGYIVASTPITGATCSPNPSVF